MTISSFCRGHLLARGPLPLETLAQLAADAGKTKALDPTAAVRAALAHKEVQLADGRWATPLWLLEGRILTARRLPIAGRWTDPYEGDDDGLLHAWDEPDLDDGLDGACHDLALLDHAMRSSPLPLAAGGVLRRETYGSGWRAPKGWPGVHPARDELLGLRVRDGQVDVELVPVNDALHVAGARLAREVGSLDAPVRHQVWWSSHVSDNLVTTLWNRMATDPAFLTSPVPPFSMCIRPLADEVRSERDRRRAAASRWRPQLDLPAHLHDIALRAAWGGDQPLLDWLNAFAARTLRELDDELDGYDADDGQVLPLQARRWR